MKCLLLFVIVFLHHASSEYDEGKVTATLELIDMDLEDECEDVSKSISHYLQRKPGSFQERIKIAETHGNYLRHRSDQLKDIFQSEDSYPYEYERNLTLLIKNGDTLLPKGQWSQLVKFHISSEDLVDKGEVPCIGDKSYECTLKLKDVEEVLSTSRNLSVLEETWSNWESIYMRNTNDFEDILRLVENASVLNEYYSVKSYWEALAEVPDGYSIAKTLWEEIEPFYKKLYDFVLVRINKFYGTNFTEIPVYLSGSKYGEDWTNIADIILPHPQFLYDINVELEGYQTSRSLYKLAENATAGMGLGKLGHQFWRNSKFNQSHCDQKVLSFCAHKFSGVLTCNNVTFDNYLRAHELAMEVAINNQDYSSLARQKLRYSAFDEALKDMGAVLGIGNLPYNGILLPEVFRVGPDGKQTNKMMALLLTALRTLPKLPYYLAADLWRLEELEIESGNLSASWWDFRKKYQGIYVPDEEFPDYIGDPYITLNKPYLGKFFGLILQFQLLDYHQIRIYDEEVKIYDSFKTDSSFKEMLKDRPNKAFMDLISYNYGINEFTSYSILQYFSPLEEYMKEAPVEQAKINPHPRRLVPTTTKKPKIRPSPKIVASSTVPAVSEAVQKVTVKPTEKVLIVKGEVAQPMSEQKRNSYIFIGVACGLIVLAILYGVFAKCRKKMKAKRTNNRRFEA